MSSKYIHIKTGKLYSLVQTNLMMKMPLINKETKVLELKWLKEVSDKYQYVLYKAEYHNPDGPFFVRTTEDFYNNFRKASIMEILLFKLSTCGPCKLMGKLLKELNISHKEMVIDDSDEAETKADELQVKSVPTIVVLDKEGNELGRICGTKTKEEILSEIEKYKHDGN